MLSLIPYTNQAASSIPYYRQARTRPRTQNNRNQISQQTEIEIVW